VRPAEVDLLIGDCTKAKKLLGWKAKTPFQELVEAMVDADLARLKSTISPTPDPAGALCYHAVTMISIAYLTAALRGPANLNA
jgi:hypothetical protein